ncbi:hypothetical protein SAMN04487895_101533 [Paenibacillus sophorae]|nr:hypothetical protein SAMN04487895_101533 [Paenibacillus sophorae]
MGYLIKEVSCIKNIEGKIRWMTEKGVLVLLKVSENLIIVKTFISKQRYRGKGHKYYQGCEVY